jgi:hypothetical protein
MALSGVIDTVVGRAIRDDAFRSQLLENPVATAEQSGYALSAEDREALAQLDGGKAAAFFQKLEAEGVPMAWCSGYTCYEIEKDVKD